MSIDQTLGAARHFTPAVELLTSPLMARPIGSGRDSDPAFCDLVRRRLDGPRACVALLHLPARCICSCPRHAAATTRRALALERVVSLAVPVPEMAALEPGLFSPSGRCRL